MMYNLELPSKNKQNLSERRTLEGYLDITQLVTWPTFNCYTACQGCSSTYYNFMRLCSIHNSELNCKMKNWKYISVFYQNFEKWTKLVLRLTIIIQSKIKIKPQGSPVYEYSISFGLPRQSYVWDIRTVGTASPSTTEFFLLVKYGWRFY